MFTTITQLRYREKSGCEHIWEADKEDTMTVQGDNLVAYFFVGPTPSDVIRQYTDLRGVCCCHSAATIMP